MARNRSTALIAVGSTVFVVGAALTFVVVGGEDETKVSISAPPGPSSAKTGAPGQAGAPPVAGVKVPADKEAVAIQIATVPGLAGYAKAGDRVNLYGTFKDRQPNAASKGPPVAKLVLADAGVLAVTAPAAGAESGNTTYLLAVNPGDAEKVVYLASFEGIWMSLTADGAPIIGATPGRTASNAI